MGLDDCVAEIESPSNKPKMFKQSRLPFSPIDSKCPKKRKLSPEKDSNDTDKTVQKNTKKRRSSIKKTQLEKETNEVIIIELDQDQSSSSTTPEEKTEVVIKGKENIENSTSHNVEVVLETESSPKSNIVVTPKLKSSVRSAKRKSSSNTVPINKLFKQIEEKKKKAENDKSLNVSSCTGTSEISSTEEGINSSVIDLVDEEDDLNESNGSSSTLNDSSLCSTPVSSKKRKTTNQNESNAKEESPFVTPKVVRTPRSNNDSSSKTPKNSNITPKQLMKKGDSLKKKAEQERKRQEKEALKKEMEEKKEMQRLEKEKKKQEELELKQKLQEEKRLKKEEEQLKKEEEKKMKEEEKKRKEEEKKMKEEEKKRKDEEKQKLKQEKEERQRKEKEERQKKEDEEKEKRLKREEEEKEKKAKEKARFSMFFVKKKVVEASPVEDDTPSTGPFKTFRVKENMKMAPICRHALEDERKMKLDSIFNADAEVDSPYSYLNDIKKSKYKFGKDHRTYPKQESYNENECEILECDEDEIIDGTDVIEEENRSSSSKTIVKAKFLKFCENRRPAYYGTWSKKPLKLSGRRPFAQENILDYEYDSDEDWEEEEAGESLSDSEGENEDGVQEELNQYEVDNDFFVPHGYLSDDEGKDNDEEDEDQEEDSNDSGNKKNKEEEDHKAEDKVQSEQLKQKQAEFELEMKQKTKQLKPKVYGCVWMGDPGCHAAYAPLLKILSAHRAVVYWGSCPIGTTRAGNPPVDESVKEDDDAVEASTKKFLKNFPEKAVPDLIRLLQGNRHSIRFLAREFNEFWKKKCTRDSKTEELTGIISLQKIKLKIQELGYNSKRVDGDNPKYKTFTVSDQILEKYGLVDLNLKNEWTYNLSPKIFPKDDDENADECQTPQQTKTSPKNLITKFTKVLNDEEKEEVLRKKFHSITPSPVTPSSSGQQKNADSVASNSISSSKKMKRKTGTPNSSGKTSISSFFKKGAKSNSPKDTKPISQHSDCITLE